MKIAPLSRLVAEPPPLPAGYRGRHAGNALVKQDDIQDPAALVARDLLQIAEQQYGVVAAGLPPAAVDTSDTAALAKAASGSDLLSTSNPSGRESITSRQTGATTG